MCILPRPHPVPALPGALTRKQIVLPAVTVSGSPGQRTREDRRVAAEDINGPRDDAYGTLAKLRRTAGDGKFDYLIQFPGPGY